MQVQTVRFFKGSFQCMMLSDFCRFRNRAARPFVCSALVETIPNNLRMHRSQGAVSNLVSGGDAGLLWVLALQRRWCWREADAGSGLEERTAGPSELLEDRDSGCPC